MRARVLIPRASAADLGHATLSVPFPLAIRRRLLGRPPERRRPGHPRKTETPTPDLSERIPDLSPDDILDGRSRSSLPARPRRQVTGAPIGAVWGLSLGGPSPCSVAGRSTARPRRLDHLADGVRHHGGLVELDVVAAPRGADHA